MTIYPQNSCGGEFRLPDALFGGDMKSYSTNNGTEEFEVIVAGTAAGYGAEAQTLTLILTWCLLTLILAIVLKLLKPEKIVRIYGLWFGCCSVVHLFIGLYYSSEVIETIAVSFGLSSIAAVLLNLRQTDYQQLPDTSPRIHEPKVDLYLLP